MSRRMALVAAAALAALGIAVGVWAAGGSGSGAADTACDEPTYTVEDPNSSKLMEYRKPGC